MRRALFAAFLLTFGAPVAAQTVTLTYRLENVWLKPDITHPWESAQPMTGSFEWTFDVGDFENGSATLVDLQVPWYGSNWQSLQIIADPGSIEINLPGNWHGLGVDVTFDLPAPMNPSAAAPIDPASPPFTIENGVPRQGHVISGSIVPDPQLDLAIGGACPTHSFQVSGAVPSRMIALLYASGPGAATVPNGRPCAGAVLGLNSGVALGRLLRANGAGAASFTASVPPGACGRVLLQALDLASCGVSAVVPMP